MTAPTQDPPRPLVNFGARIPPALRTQAKVYAAVCGMEIQDLQRYALTQFVEIPPDLRVLAGLYAAENRTTVETVIREALAAFLGGDSTKDS